MTIEERIKLIEVLTKLLQTKYLSNDTIKILYSVLNKHLEMLK